MVRKPGDVAKTHKQTRETIVSSVTQHVLAANGQVQSLRELGRAAGVEPATLRHYFKDRSGLIAAVFDSLLPAGQAQRLMAMQLLTLPAQEAFVTLLKRIAAGWPILGGLHALGFAEGFADSELGQMYIANIFEPTLATFEEMLSHYAGKGELDIPDPRVAGLAMLSPVLLGLFHQQQLSGRRCRPLDVDTFIELHVSRFLKGYAAHNYAPHKE